MPGCAAVNCKNRSSKGFRLFRFPADPQRRKKWLINCRRGEWKPTQTDYLCSVHFEESQFEQRRADKKRFLVPFAVPTLFSVPDPPKKHDAARKSAYKRRHQFKLSEENADPLEMDHKITNFPPMSGQDDHGQSNDVNNAPTDEVTVLKQKILELEGKLKRQTELFSSFLTQEQMEKLEIEEKCIWK